jgi:hypothetical protein
MLFYSDQIRKIVKLPEIIPLEYKRHESSLTEKTSYRNPTLVYRAPPRQNNYRDRTDKPDHRQAVQQGDGSYQQRPGWRTNSRWGNSDKNSGNVGDNSDPQQYSKPKDDVNPGSGWRRNRTDFDNSERGGGGGYHKNHESRGDKNSYQSTERLDREKVGNNPTTTTISHDKERPIVSSSTYSAGKGSFASRLKQGTSNDSLPPSLTGFSDLNTNSSGPAGMTRIANPFAKEVE